MKTLFCALLLVLCLNVPSALADGFLQKVGERDFLTGDWGGARTDWDEKGFSFEAVYTGEVSNNQSGGIRHETVYLDNIDLTLSVDAEKAAGWKGATFFIYSLINHGGSPSENVGDAQGVSNIDAPHAWKIYEAWFQQNLFDDKLSVLAGLYDLNSEFDAIETAGLFFNSSHGIGPDFSQSGQNGPSIFPTTSAGIRVKIQPTESWYFQAVVLDGVPGDPENPRGTHSRFDKDDGALLTVEIAWLTGTGEESDAPYGKTALGVWRYTEDFDDLRDVDASGNPVKRSGNGGVYLLAERSVYREKNDSSQGLAVYGRYGIADDDVNQFDSYLGGGLVYTGLIPGRDEDQAGLSVAVAHNGNKFKRASKDAGASVNSSETTLELSYRAQVNPWFAIQPDIQYVIHPGTDPAVDDAFVIGTRFEVVF